MRKGLEIAKDAISNTGIGERTFYLVLIAAGMLLIVIGLRADAHGWAVAHPYAINLLDGATGFCFGIPVAGVVIREVTRRTRRRIALDTFIVQLDYLGRLVKELSPGPARKLSDRLRELAKAADVAAFNTSATAKVGPIRLKFFQIGVIIVRPELPKGSAASLRTAVEARQVWTSVSFACGRLISDATLLISLLYSSKQQPDPWFDRLMIKLEAMRSYPPAVNWRWLPVAVNPKGSVPVSAWSLASLSASEADDDLAPTADPTSGEAQPSPSLRDQALIEKEQLAEAIKESAKKELEDETRDLSNRLAALADLVDAAGRCRYWVTASGGKQDWLEVRIIDQPQWRSFDDVAYLVVFMAEITNTTGQPVDVRHMWLAGGPGDEAALHQDAREALDREYQARLSAATPPHLRPGTIRARDSVVGLSVHKVLRSAVDGHRPRCFFVVMDAEGNTYTERVPPT
jgi:hypothetical protein